MSSDLTASNNQLLKNIGNQILNNNKLEELCNQEVSKQKDALKAVFTKISDNDVSSAEKLTLEKGAADLTQKIADLEKQMKALKAQIEEKSDKVQDKTDEITGLILNAQNESSIMENEHKDVVNGAVKDVFDEYKRGNIGQDRITAEIASRIRSSSKLKSHQAVIEKILGNLSSKKAQATNLANEAAGLIDQKNLLENQYNIKKSACDLINKTISQIGNTKTSYTNSDTNTAVPIYSLAKTDIITNIFNKYTPDEAVQQQNETAYIGKAQTQADIETNFAQYLNTPKGNVKDIYTYDNPAVKSLESALNDENFTNALKNSNMSVSDLGKFFAKNFANAGVRFDDKTGTIKIPYGHGEQGGKAKQTFNALSAFMKGYTEPNGSRYYSSDALSIGTNSDLKKLNENNNYAKIIDQLATGNPKFTFKEAMYALFDKNNGLFKNSGINYDLAFQGNPPSYTIGNAQDKETYTLYQNIASKIKQSWGVDANFSNSNIPENRYDEKVEEKRTDPISFKQGNTEYAFVIDRNQDGAFTDLNEFVGAQNGSTWLDDLKSLDENNDGKLTGDELKNLKMLASEYKDNVQTTTDGEYLRSDTNDINYSMTDAKSLGIEEISLAGLENKVNDSQGKTDINGSELFNDSIEFKMNGQNIKATRKDDKDSFMNTVYGSAKNKNFNIGLSAQEVEATFENNANIAKGQFGDYAEFEENINLLKHTGDLEEQSRSMYEIAKDRIANDQQAELLKANNKARAQSTLSSWSNIEIQVRSIATSEGIKIDMEQAKGIYNSHLGLSANGVINEYKKQAKDLEQSKNARDNSSVAWEALIKSYKNGINATADQINKIVSEGKANTVDGILEILKQEQTK